MDYGIENVSVIIGIYRWKVCDVGLDFWNPIWIWVSTYSLSYRKKQMHLCKIYINMVNGQQLSQRDLKELGEKRLALLAPTLYYCSQNNLLIY